MHTHELGAVRPPNKQWLLLIRRQAARQYLVQHCTPITCCLAATGLLAVVVCSHQQALQSCGCPHAWLLARCNAILPVHMMSSTPTKLGWLALGCVPVRPAACSMGGAFCA